MSDTIHDDILTALDAIDNEVKRDRLVAEAGAKLGQGRVDLVMGRDAAAVYFATVAMRLQLVPDATIDTAGTDGRRIVYNPAFIAGLDRKQIVGLFAHEVMHITNAHHARMGDRDPQLWNIACDLCINPVIRSAGLQLPANICFPGEDGFADLPVGLSAEEYYSALQKKGGDKGDDQSGTPGADPGRCGGVLKPGKGSEAECRKAEAEAKEMAAAAQQAVKSSGRGDLPLGIGSAIKDLLEPKADWRAILREFVARTSKNDYSWSRPNRRFIHAGVYLPGMHSEELGDVVLAVDESGSISDELLAQFASETQAVLEAYECKLTILHHDTVIQKIDEWRSTDGPLVLERHARGGTSHVAVFEHIAREGINPACVICLTDLDTEFPNDPGIPTYETRTMRNAFRGRDRRVGRRLRQDTRGSLRALERLRAAMRFSGSIARPL